MAILCLCTCRSRNSFTRLRNAGACISMDIDTLSLKWYYINKAGAHGKPRKRSGRLTTTARLQLINERYTMTLTDLLQFAKAGWKPADVKELLAHVEPKEPEPKADPEPKQTDPEPVTDNGTPAGSGTTPAEQTGGTDELLKKIEDLQNQLKQAQALNVGQGASTPPEKSAVDLLQAVLEDMNGGKPQKKE